MRIRSFVSAVLGAVLAAGTVLAGGSHAADTAAPRTDLADIDAYLRERAEATRTPGLAYAIVTPDSIEHIGTRGHDGDGEPVTGDTPFLWGSVAKPMTATVVMDLVEAGTVVLDEPVRTYLPSFTLADGDAAARITVRHLLGHTSGIPDGTGTTDRFDHGSDPYGEAVADLADAAPSAAPGEKHEYSSANYLVLGAVVESVTGRSFTGHLRDRLLEPLEMEGAVTSPDEAGAALADGHGYVLGQPVRITPRYDRAGPSYGYLGGTVEDLAHFAMLQLNGGRYRSAQVLDPASVELMQTGTAPVGDTHRYGLGWRDDTRNADLGTRTVWHTGAVPGYQAMVLLLPDIDRGIVVLQNIFGSLQDSELAETGFGAARMLAGGQPGATSGDLAHPGLPAVLAAVLLAVVAVVVRSVRGLLRSTAGPERPRRILAGTACRVLGGLALAHLAGVLVPDTVGVRLQMLTLWAPDVGWLLAAVSATGLVLASVGLVGACTRLRRTGVRPFARRTAAPAEPAA
ncbi:serine hydrolase domain-containing protein [Streptomyces sp. HB2AG]|uniref:serine hydrolase domain-containing protein n=1 Tax=Streptomyces sp. HB2AG TaxID=2983400 RepID=UPI0022AAFFAD|nr:serine hydrolase domain-containing protein [Streptomyces sp. HB2AG]MCZ2523427.1 serine hydrolase [Streptomyces sp. HB2AG]